MLEYFSEVEAQVQQIRALLQSREGRASERVWLPRQSPGELAEARAHRTCAHCNSGCA